jgi:hypothetical protein
MPTSSEQASRKALADGYAKALCDAIASDGELQRLWSVLQVFPFEIEAADKPSEIDEQDAVPIDWADVQLPPNRWHFRSSAKADPFWSRPRMDIGCIVLRRETKMFVLPQAVADKFMRKHEDDDGDIPEAVLDALKSEGVSMYDPSPYTELGDLLHEQGYDPEAGFGWTPVTTYDFVRVRLKVVPDDAGLPKAVIDFFYTGFGIYVDVASSRVGGAHRASTNVDSVIKMQAANRNDRETFTNMREASIGAGWINARLVFVEPHNVWDSKIDAKPVGILEPSWRWDTPSHVELDTDTVLDWCDTPEWAEMMLTDTYSFVPAFELSERRTPFPAGSIAHALFSNLQLDDPEKRLDRSFLVHVRRTAEIGLEWYGRLIDEAQIALETIK